MNAAAANVRVNLGERSYSVAIGSGTLPQAGQWLGQLGRVSHAVVITDANVEQPHAVAVGESLAETGVEVDLIVVDPGESTKSVATATELWSRLLQLGADRKTAVVAVGGGVVGDLAGFVAATYARGVRFVQVPTTLLAQVDSSVGGKVGVNLPAAKNMVGAFLQPLGVLVDTKTLDTLDAREYRSGLAEVVKYGVILDADLFALLEANTAGLLRRSHSLLTEVVGRCCRLKADVVEQDEREETGRRAILNYGHTFGHAFEALAGYGELLHGEAVAIGMHCAARLARRLGRVDDRFVERQQRLLTALELPIEAPALDPDQVLKTMMHDKKVEHGRLRLILPTGLGQVELVADVPAGDIRQSLG